MPRRFPFTPVTITLGIVAARLLRVNPLSDPVGHPLPASLHLAFPAPNLIAAPLFDLWDSVSMLSMSRLIWFTGSVLIFFVLWRVVAAFRRRRGEPDAGPPLGLIRETGVTVLFLAVFAAFITIGLIWHRPMAALRGAPADAIVVDFHSHTNASHDVSGTLMKGYSPEANRRWHARAGFDATFITDHNTVGGLPSSTTMPSLPLLCPGIEVSAWRAHIVLLGTRSPVDRSPYTDSLGGVLQLLRESERKFGGITIASLPEYEKNHWENLEALIAAGLDGFEIVNASPRANEMTEAHREHVITLARAHDLLLVGVTDNHGWGATVMSWNLVQVEGWRENPGLACGRLVQRLETGGTEAVQIIERRHLRTDSGWPMVLTPLGVLWESWRSSNPFQVLSWLSWTWGVTMLLRRRREGS